MKCERVGRNVYLDFPCTKTSSNPHVGHQVTVTGAAANDVATDRLFLVDITTGRRMQLSMPAVYPVWSADAQYLYFGAPPHEIFRVHVPGGREERVLEVPFRTASTSFGLTPNGDLILLREHGHYDIYALSLATR